MPVRGIFLLHLQSPTTQATRTVTATATPTSSSTQAMTTTVTSTVMPTPTRTPTATPAWQGDAVQSNGQNPMIIRAIVPIGPRVTVDDRFILAPVSAPATVKQLIGMCGVHVAH